MLIRILACASLITTLMAGAFGCATPYLLRSTGGDVERAGALEWARLRDHRIFVGYEAKAVDNKGANWLFPQERIKSLGLRTAAFPIPREGDRTTIIGEYMERNYGNWVEGLFVPVEIFDRKALAVSALRRTEPVILGHEGAKFKLGMKGPDGQPIWHDCRIEDVGDLPPHGATAIRVTLYPFAFVADGVLIVGCWVAAPIIMPLLLVASAADHG